MLKKDIRHKYLAKRIKMPREKAEEYSTFIQDKITKAAFWPKSGRIGLYYPIKNEVMTQTIFQRAIEGGLKVYFPRVEKGINLYEVNGPEDLQKGSWGISEPSRHCPELAEDSSLDLLIVPGIAFTEDCYRIGYGKKFYDQFIRDRLPNTPTVGLAYEYQMIDSFLVEEWDQRLQGVMTENNFYSTDIKI